ncbi:MAG: hypothetical protein EZS28_031253, partial [Streblomastix strix]
FKGILKGVPVNQGLASSLKTENKVQVDQVCDSYALYNQSA